MSLPAQRHAIAQGLQVVHHAPGSLSGEGVVGVGATLDGIQTGIDVVPGG